MEKEIGQIKVTETDDGIRIEITGDKLKEWLPCILGKGCCCRCCCAGSKEDSCSDGEKKDGKEDKCC